MKNLPLSGIEVFLAIVRHGSLRAAARSLGLGAPAVSHQLKALETALGVSLLTRTTRSIRLTEAGKALLRGAGPAIDQLCEAVDEAREAGKAKKGVLRLTLPWSAYNIAIEPVLAEFQALYPEICLEMSFDEGLVDIVQSGFHAGIRLGDRLTADMVAVRLTPALHSAYSAAPSYLDLHGRPGHPRDLLTHKCIRYRFVSANRIADWLFRENGRDFTVDPPTGLVFDNFRSVIGAAREGHGIGWSLREVVRHELERGELETVLDRFTVDHPPFYLYYPQQHRRLELLRIFIDFLVERRPDKSPS